MSWLHGLAFTTVGNLSSLGTRIFTTTRLNSPRSGFAKFFTQQMLLRDMRPNDAIDSDDYSAPLRAPIIARHHGRWAGTLRGQCRR